MSELPSAVTAVWKAAGIDLLGGFAGDVGSNVAIAN